MENINISVKTDFSEYPGIRYNEQGPESGEAFFDNVLKHHFQKAIDNNVKLVVDLDGTAGYTPSFLDESFGRLVYDFGKEQVAKHIIIISSQEPNWIEMINNETFPQWEVRRSKGEKYKITEPVK